MCCSYNYIKLGAVGRWPSGAPHAYAGFVAVGLGCLLTREMPGDKGVRQPQQPCSGELSHHASNHVSLPCAPCRATVSAMSSQRTLCMIFEVFGYITYG